MESSSKVRSRRGPARTGRAARLLSAVVIVPALLTGVAVAVPAGGSGPSAAAPPTRPDAGAPLANGSLIGTDPSLHAGQHIAIAVPGFAAGAVIELAILSRAPLGQAARADSRGIARVDFHVPANLAPGHYRLSISGHATSSGPTPPAETSALSETIAFTVPRIAIFRFSVAAPPHGQSFSPES